MLDINQIEVNDFLVDTNYDRFKVIAMDCHGSILKDCRIKNSQFFLTWEDIRRDLFAIIKG